MRGDGIAARIAAAALTVAAVTLAIVAIGVMRVGSDAFAALMIAAGHPAEEAHAMFDSSVAVVVAIAAIVAAIAGLGLALVFARRIARPIEDLAAVAGRAADGDLRTQAVDAGPAEVRALAASFNVMVDRLAEQESIRREFVINATHELRTPLTNLQGYLEALRDGVLPPDPATFDSLREEVDRIGRLAESLDLLVGGEGNRPMPEDLDLASLARSAAELAAPALARRSIAWRVEADDAVRVHARRDEMAQVLSNLLQNAVRYTPVGGSVQVAVERRDAEAIVRITNSGPGIPAADLARVWERFYRVEKSRDRASGGAGIGLAIVKRLVEEAGGHVGVTSAPGATSFWFSLPT
jgi:two-component system, OmpR family, sensor histidine kinase BaeS